jgi:uncharacterized protein YndB with AHSA1/START domain
VAQIHHRVTIDAAVAVVYQAIATADGISVWWDKQTPVQTDRGLVLEHDPGAEHGIVRLRVVELVPNQRIDWECISTHPASRPASAWTGTHFIFELGEEAAPAPPRRPSISARPTTTKAARPSRPTRPRGARC